MNRIRIAALGAAALMIVAGAGAASAQLTWKGYLSDTALDAVAVLPPAPAPGSPQAEADRAIFRATRALKGTPRWDMAIADLDERRIVQNMSCAIGVELDPAALPRLTALLIRTAPDVTRVVDAPKDLYGRPRPYLVDEGEICTDRSDRLARSPDYPSGHATWGWVVGLIMAELIPDRASPILARARAFGESRAFCGVHNASAVAAGRTNGAAVVAALHGSAEFREDMENARAEVAEALKSGKAPTGCEAEAEALKTALW